MISSRITAIITRLGSIISLSAPVRVQRLPRRLTAGHTALVPTAQKRLDPHNPHSLELSRWLQAAGADCPATPVAPTVAARLTFASSGH